MKYFIPTQLYEKDFAEDAVLLLIETFILCAGNQVINTNWR